MAQGYSFESFAAEIDIAHSTLYKWVHDFPEFAKAKAVAYDKCRSFWEKVGMQGLMGETEGKFNSAIWIFNMKNRFQWTDRHETKTEHTHKLENIIGESIEPRQVENEYRAVEIEHKEEDNELEHERDDEDPLA
jgi:hypothetical protein